MKPTAFWTAALASVSLAGCADILRDMEQSQAEPQPMRSAGAPMAQAPRLAADETLVRDVQRELRAQGVDAGPVDGIWGPQTAQGVREFQRAQGMKPSGRLDLATLDALGILNGASAGGSDARGKSLFERVDKNDDGAVSREEFNATLGAPRARAGQPPRKPSFARLDANEDGYVSLAEAGADTRISRDFNRADANGDGRLDHKEFLAAAEMTASAGGTQPGEDKALVKKVQQQLNAKGFDAGAVDGVMGSATRRALENFQEAQGMKASGELDRKTLSALDIPTK